MPLPEKFTVGVYENPTQKMYQEELMVEIARSMPDIDFKFFGDPTRIGNKETDNIEHLGWIDLDEKMKDFSCNLRISVHDGLPLTPLQFLTAGRNVVTNVQLEGAIIVDPDRKKIIEGIRKAQEEQLLDKVGKKWHKVLSVDKYRRAIWSS
jgi:hypothetical protein